jgi:hypothetical protein
VSVIGSFVTVKTPTSGGRAVFDAGVFFASHAPRTNATTAMASNGARMPSGGLDSWRFCEGKLKLKTY